MEAHSACALHGEVSNVVRAFHAIRTSREGACVLLCVLLCFWWGYAAVPYLVYLLTRSTDNFACHGCFKCAVPGLMPYAASKRTR
eukprot:6188063-Pleurochrysis_carterae.AAC.2